MLESKLPELIRDDSGELPLKDSGERPPTGSNLTPEDLTTIENAITQLSLPYVQLSRYLSSAPPARDKERLGTIEKWREEQRQQVNERRTAHGVRRADAEALGQGQQGAVVDQKQREVSMHRGSQKPAGQKPIGQRPGNNSAELEKEAEQRLTQHCQEVACQAEEAEKKFWDLLPGFPVLPGMTFVPFPSSKQFTAAEALEFPLEDAARR